MSKPRFSIITTCKGRLDHLKQTLPAMLTQKNAEVIVVDFSCPDGTAAYVRQHYRAVKVVEVQNKNYFYNGEARNRGAERATGEQLIFCDADTVLAPFATNWLSNNLGSNAIGTFATKESNDPKARGEGLGRNQLRGFQVISAKHFFSLGGYDEVLRGYAVGFDTDLLDMGIKLGLHPQPIRPKIIERVIEHDNAARLFHHTMPLKQSYLASLLIVGSRAHWHHFKQMSGYPWKCVKNYSKMLFKRRVLWDQTMETRHSVLNLNLLP